MHDCRSHSGLMLSKNLPPLSVHSLGDVWIIEICGITREQRSRGGVGG